MRSTDCEGCFCYAVCDDDLLQADMTLASAGYRLNDFFSSRFTLLHSSFSLGFMHHPHSQLATEPQPHIIFFS